MKNKMKNGTKSDLVPYLLKEIQVLRKEIDKIKGDNA